jgi:chromosome segregation ATPase
MSSNTDDQFKELREVVYKTKDTVERVEANWDKDRKDFSEFINRVGHLETEFKALRETLQKLPQRTQDKVLESVQPVIDATDSLTETIEKKKLLPFKIKKGSWWKFW